MWPCYNTYVDTRRRHTCTFHRRRADPFLQTHIDMALQAACTWTGCHTRDTALACYALDLIVGPEVRLCIVFHPFASLHCPHILSAAAPVFAQTPAQVGREYGTTTGRPRRVGWLDMVALRYVIK